MEKIKKALQLLDKRISEQNKHAPFSFQDFINLMYSNPSRVLRNIFQVFNDMVNAYVGEGFDEYPDDPESINFINYDCTKLFVEGADHPFFADRLFANRFIKHVDALKVGAQQNKIYIFDGPPGCGKSTFLNNLLRKFEEYASTENGTRYETVWRLKYKDLEGVKGSETNSVMNRMMNLLSHPPQQPVDSSGAFNSSLEQNLESYLTLYHPDYVKEDYIEIPCPSHDHPILMVPKEHRRSFLDDLFQNDEFKWKLFTEKEYEWVFHDVSCTICSSLYDALLNKLNSPTKVFEMIYARHYEFNRRLGEGITVFNPGDAPMRQIVLANPMLQGRINSILKDSNQVRYIFSQYAKTNNGIYALMDIKSHNIDRLIELHNIVSEAVHKVEYIEENVNSLFIALMNPEDKKNIQDFQSFSDRIVYINIPYVLDIQTEVNIYRNIFGKRINECFLPRVLHNFARVIISSRLNTRSEALLEWIGSPDKYRQYCDENLQLLKMEIYTGHIPPWLSEEDRKAFTAQRRRKIIAESENEGNAGFSGRDAIKIFNEFFSICSKEDSLINMSALNNYFTNVRKDLSRSIPSGFIDALLHMYNYTVLQEVKEALYYFNEDKISQDIQNYMFAVSFEPNTEEICKYTGDRLEITEDFFRSIENHLLGSKTVNAKRLSFRKDVQKEYASRTLTQEILMEGKPISETFLYNALHERYIFNLKEKVLDPFIENKNFRMAIKDFGNEDFKTYDKRIRNDVSFLINNLCNKHRYTQQGAKEICIYVVDNDLLQKFSASA